MALLPVSSFPSVTIKQEPPDDPPALTPSGGAGDLSSPHPPGVSPQSRPRSAGPRQSPALKEQNKNHDSASGDKQLSPLASSAGPSGGSGQEESVTSEGKEEGYECDICLARFRSARAFRSHGVVHKLGAEGLGRGMTGGEDLFGSVFKAGLGGRGGGSEGELPPFRCHECQTTFASRDTYAMHMLLRAKHETCCSRLPEPGKQEPASPSSEQSSGTLDSTGKMADPKVPTSSHMTGGLLGYSAWPKMATSGRSTLSSPRAWLRDWLTVEKEVLVCHICREIFANKDALAMHVFCHTRSEIEANAENEAATSRWSALGSPHMRTLAEKLALRMVAVGGKMPPHLPYLSPVPGGAEGGLRISEAHTSPEGPAVPRENGAVFPSTFRRSPLPQSKGAPEDARPSRGKVGLTPGGGGSPNEAGRPRRQERLEADMAVSPEWPSLLDEEGPGSQSPEQQLLDTGLDLSKHSLKSASSGEERASPVSNSRATPTVAQAAPASTEPKSPCEEDGLDHMPTSGDLNGERGRWGRKVRGSPRKSSRPQPYPSPSDRKQRPLPVTPSPEPDVTREGGAATPDLHLASARAALERCGGHVGMCRHCDIIFLDRTLYQLHMGLHNVNNPWQCNACGKVLSNRLQFSSHVLHY